MSSTPSQHASNSDISFSFLVKLIIRYFKFLVLFMVFCLVAAILYNLISPKKYTSKASFLLPPSALSGSSSVLGGYAQLLGASPQGAIGKSITAIVYSNRIRSDVVTDIVPQFPDHSVEDVSKKLDLKDNLSFYKDKNGTFFLEFEHTSQEMAQLVVQIYIRHIVSLNKTLKLVADKEIIIVLDPASYPKVPSKPRTILNIILALFLATFGGVFLIITYDFIRTLNQRGWQ